MPVWLLLAAAAVAAEAPRPGPVETLQKRVVEAIRNCPEAGPGEITVCAPDRGIAEGYRIPRMDPRFAGTLRKSGRGEVPAAGPPATGVGSCTATGAGGFTGCAAQDYKTWGTWRMQQKAQGQGDDPMAPW